MSEIIDIKFKYYEQGLCKEILLQSISYTYPGSPSDDYIRTGESISSYKQRGDCPAMVLTWFSKDYSFPLKGFVEIRTTGIAEVYTYKSVEILPERPLKNLIGPKDRRYLAVIKDWKS